MIALWDFYWPALTACAVIGVLIGVAAFRATTSLRPKTPGYRRRAWLVCIAGGALALGAGALWHGPVGTADRFAASIERQAQQVLVDWEMTQDQARIARGPLKRTVILSGPADEFQRSELARIMNLVPGVGSVRWADMPEGLQLPLLAEVALASLGFFGLGLLLAYLLELRRRYRAQWSW